MNLCKCGRKKFGHENLCAHCRNAHPVRQHDTDSTPSYSPSLYPDTSSGMDSGSASASDTSSSDSFSGGGTSDGGGASGSWE